MIGTNISSQDCDARNDSVSSPCLYFSYSWVHPQHARWIECVANELLANGFDVILDRRNVSEGHDAIAFMETMIADPNVSKVALVCDETQATKPVEKNDCAPGEHGKFVAVISAKDADGKKFPTTNHTSRIYIDMSESEKFGENFDKLLRWVFDRPSPDMPVPEKTNSPVTEQEAPAIRTAALAHRAMDSLRGEKPYASEALDEYLASFARQLEQFRLVKGDGELDDRIVKSINDFLPARNEFVQVIATLTQYADTEIYAPRLHRFYESLIPYLSRPPHLHEWDVLESDNFRFIVHELFLYGIALMLKEEHFGTADYLLGQPYYVPGKSDYGQNATVSFTALHKYVQSLENRNIRLKLNRISLAADLLEQRPLTSGVSFQHLMQADFVCFLRSDMMGFDEWEHWWPDTLMCAQKSHGPFEIFVRASSKAYLPRVLKTIGATDLSALAARFESYTQDDTLTGWSYQSLNPETLSGLEQLGTRP